MCKTFKITRGKTKELQRRYIETAESLKRVYTGQYEVSDINTSMSLSMLRHLECPSPIPGLPHFINHFYPI